MLLEHLVNDWAQWLDHLSPLGIYTFLFFISYLENVVPPIPGDLIVAFGGYLIAEGIISFGWTYVGTVVGAELGFLSMFYFGKYFGYRIDTGRHHNWFFRRFDFEYLNRVRKWMDKYGQLVVVANRFLAGTRSIISITAGFSHTPPLRTAMSALLSSILWNAVLLGAGWLVHDNWRIIGTYLSTYGKIVFGLIVLFFVLRWCYRWYNKRKEAE